MSSLRAIPAAIILSLAVSSVSWAIGFGAAYDPVGVYLDGDGVLKSKTNDPDPRLAEIRKKAAGRERFKDLCYISIPRILAEAKRCIDEGKEIPEHLRYLGGMVKIQYIFVYPEEGDLVIAGPAEPYETTIPYRPLGLITGRPVLHLEDLVVALRATNFGKNPDRLGCDIEIHKEIAERIDKKVAEVISKYASLGGKKACEEIAKAGGEQPVHLFGLDPNTRFAFVCIEADYRLKQLGLGLLKPPSSRVKSYYALLMKPEKPHRFSLESNYDALLVSPDGLAYELRGPSIKVNGGLMARLGFAGEMSETAKAYVRMCNENIDELCRNIISWSDLANLSDLSVLAAIMVKDELTKKIKWDLSWLADARRYPIVPMTTPKACQTLCNYNVTGGMVLFHTGGVWLNPLSHVDKREQDQAGKLKRPKRPDKEIIIPTQSGK